MSKRNTYNVSKSADYVEAPASLMLIVCDENHKMIVEKELDHVNHNTVYRIVTNINLRSMVLVTVCWTKGTVKLTMYNEKFDQLEEHELSDLYLRNMCLDTNWDENPVPDMVLDDSWRLFISWSETFCVDLNKFDTDGTDEDAIVEYQNNPMDVIEEAIYSWRFKDTEKFLVTWNRVNTYFNT